MKLFVGTYCKFSVGNMYGKWLNLDDFSCAEDFILACHRIHRDEKNPDFMFRGYKVGFEWEIALYDEYAVPLEYWAVKEELKRQFFDEDTFSAFVYHSSEYPSVYLVRKCAASYLGEFGSLENYLKWFYRYELCVSEMDESEFEWYLSEYENCGNLECVNGYIFQS